MLLRPAFVFVGCWSLACTPPVEPTTAPIKQQMVYDISWNVLVRDYATAHSYTDQRVRIRLDTKDYRIEGSEIRVYSADNGAPAIIVIRHVDPLPDRKLPALIVTGTCRGPTRDGTWRSRNADFYVILDNAQFVVR